VQKRTSKVGKLYVEK